MKIAQNIPALLSNRQLVRSADKVQKSSVRLSSGIKLQGAQDDAASYAISIKMKQQIAGLERASQNALDGISLIQTADGALNEMSEIVKRIRTLAIQSSNDVLTPEDRDKINIEVKSLIDEVNRISKGTEFNGVNLLGGDLSRLTYVPSSDWGLYTDPRVSDSVESGEYSFVIDKLGMPAVAYGANSATTTFSTSGSIFINREEIKIEAGETRDSVMSKITEVCSRSDITVYNSNATGFDLRFNTNQAGSQYSIDITSKNTTLLTELGLNSIASFDGTDAKISGLAFTNAEGATVADFPANSSVTASGNRVLISSIKSRELVFDLKVNIDLSTTIPVAMWGATSVPISTNLSGPATKTFTVRDEGNLNLQLGPDKFMDLNLQISKLSSFTLGLDRVNLGTLGDSQLAIGYCEKALTTVLDVRSKLGAYENRLNYTVKSLDVAQFNTSSSLSVINDTDMAKEMTEYSTQNVIQQAAIAIIAQANARPQQLLQLLR